MPHFSTRCLYGILGVPSLVSTIDARCKAAGFIELPPVVTLRWMVLHVLAWLMADAAPRNTRPLGRPPAGASPTAARVDTNVPPVWKLLTATLFMYCVYRD
mmetsp:Transcript_9247/g.28141  ORF Transcript_9247/g.28141 Transcript_9247/m.28141 type:complete len:101 (-) Transcript_9247:1026-1328(-)